MRKLGLVIGLSVAALLSACGGGGGSSGATQERYNITLRADARQLPINISHIGAGIGAYAPYTTTLYVEAREGNRAIPGGDDIFACNIVQGFESGSLYYLDGDDEHEDDDGNPLAYRSVVLGSNSGAATFHFHAGDKAGTARVTCSVTNPRDNEISSASVDITVGAATGLPASVLGITQAPGYLGSQFNTNDIRNNVAIQAFVMDDANQPIPNPGASNVQVRILPLTAAAEGARLLLGTQVGGSVVQARTEQGVALFSLASGPARGVILLELRTDRFDNDVTNGIQDPVAQLMAVSVVDAVAAEPLAASAVTLDVPNGTPYAQALAAVGGLPPYTWTALGPLPSGLSLSSAGLISGTSRVPPGTYAVPVRVTDGSGASVDTTVTLNISGLAVPPLVITAASASAPVNLPFSYALTVTGGRAPYTWAALGGMPDGLNFSAAGVISGTPTTPGSYTVAVRVTDSDGTSVTANVGITVTAPATATP